MNSMRARNVKFASLAAGKQLQYHQKKSCFLIFGTENYQAKTRLDIQEEQVMLGRSQISENCEEKYLGDLLSSRGLAVIRSHFP